MGNRRQMIGMDRPTQADQAGWRGQTAAHTGSTGWLKRTDSSSHRINRLVEEDRQQPTQAPQAG